MTRTPEQVRAEYAEAQRQMALGRRGGYDAPDIDTEPEDTDWQRTNLPDWWDYR